MVGDDMVDKNYLGLAVKDSEGVEVGFVDDTTDDYFIIGEGPGDVFRLNKTLVGKEKEGSLHLKNTVYNILMESTVYDSQGEKIGTVAEVIETGDVVDTMIIDTSEGEETSRDKEAFVYAVLEEVETIDIDTLVLNIPYEELKFHNQPHTIRETVWDRVKHLFGG